MLLPSRKMFAGFVCVGMISSIGCGSKPQPEQPNVAITPEPLTANNENTTKQVEPTYELEAAKQSIPSGPVRGMLLGEKVNAEVNIEGPMVIRKPAGAAGPDWQIQIELPADAKRGEPYRLVTQGDQANGPAVTINYPQPLVMPKYEFETAPNGSAIKRSVVGWQSPTTGLSVMSGYSLTLELGKRVGNKVPGKLYLALPELETKSHPVLRDFLAGNFEATSVRQPNDPPGPDDVPYVTGSIAVVGGKNDDSLIVGYLATPSPELFAFATTDLPLQEAVGVARSARVDYDKPRVTLLTMGASKDGPARYEHSRLTPGRYLVFAGVKGGATVGKWVNVTSTGTHSLDMTVDATQTGGLEVSFPVEVLGKAQVAPASDDMNQEPTDPALFTAIALQLGLEQEIVARKAVFKGLIPGKYEVRAGGHSRIVDVIAGKIVELDFDKKLEPKKTEPIGPEIKLPEPKKTPEPKP